MFTSRRIATSGGGDKFRDEYSLAFDGSNDYISIPETTYDVDGGTVSFTFWAKRNNISVQNLVMASHNSFKNINLHSNGSMYIETDTNEDTASATITQDTNWHHYVITCNSGTVAMYQDGVALSMNDDSISDDITFNKISTSSSKVFNGNISEIAIYNCTLTANQVKTIYNGREPYNHKEGVASGNLTSWYRMGDGTLDTYGVICNEKNNTLGTDVVVNGTFDSDSNWTKGTGWTIGSGTADCDGSQTGNSSLAQTYASGFTSGKQYQVQFTISDYTAGNVNPHITGASSGNVNGNGTKTSVITATSSNNDIVMYADSAFDAKIDNITIREIGDGAGAMKNMSATDIEGDTP